MKLLAEVKARGAILTLKEPDEGRQTADRLPREGRSGVNTTQDLRVYEQEPDKAGAQKYLDQAASRSGCESQSSVI